MLAVCATGSAQAAAIGALLPAGLSALVHQPYVGCAPGQGTGQGPVAGLAASGASKSAAILGGQPSRLELIASQQSGLATGLPRPSTLRTSAPSGEPAPGGATACAAFPGDSAVRLASLGITRREMTPSGDFLASRRVAIGRSPFDREWARIGRERIDPSRFGGLMGASDLNPTLATLAAVNAWTNAQVRYVEDEELYGRADYWAGARRTLRARAGDCEDIAIVKLQLLAAMGVDRSDMFLTIARDLARNADHAVLVVRLGGRNWLLDNSTPEVLDAASSHDYRPILSYSADRKWLHGY